MADLDSILKDLQEIKAASFDINSAFLKVSKSSDDLVGKIANLSGTSQRLGAAWSVFSRLTVGLAPNIHKAEAALRSVAYIAKYVEVSRAAEAKANKEILDTMRDINKTQSKSHEMLNLINKAREDGASQYNIELAMQNEQIALLVKQHGLENGLFRAKKLTMGILDKTLKMERDINKEKFKQSYKEGKKGGEVRRSETLLGGLIAKTTGKNQFRGFLGRAVRAGDETLIGQYRYMRNDKSLEQRLNNLKNESGQIESSFNQRRAAARDEEISRIAEQERRQEELRRQRNSRDTVGRPRMSAIAYGRAMLESIAEIDEARKSAEKIRKQIDKEQQNYLKSLIKLEKSIGEEIETHNKNTEALEESLKARGYEISKTGQVRRRGFRSYMKEEGKFKGFKSYVKGSYGEDSENFMEIVRNNEALAGLFTPLMPVISAAKAAMGIFKLIKPTFKILRTFLGQAIRFFAGAFLTITAIAALVYYLQSKGVFEYIADFFKDKWPKFKDLAIRTYERISGAVKQVITLAGYYFDFISALFSGETEKAKEAFGNIVNWFKKAWNSIWTKHLPDFLTFLGKQMVALLEGVEKLIKNNLPKWLGGEGIGSQNSEAVREFKKHAVFGPVGLAVYAGKKIMGKEDGGPVSANTPYIVGERRPELFIPSTSGTIIPNVGGNTINVHVNGRVGATDQELNDLARKLGEKINREMNRFGASGYRA